jgi:hypothetical protein
MVVRTLSIVTAEERTLGFFITCPQVILRAAFCLDAVGLFGDAARPKIPDILHTLEAGRTTRPISSKCIDVIGLT